MAALKSFDRVAGVYRGLEYVSFGRSLEAARYHYVTRLRDCRDVVIIGEGDGRFLARFLQIAPHARVRCIDSSRAMLARAQRRLTVDECARVSFEQADLRTVTIEPAACDAVVTMFVLDCLSPDDVTSLAQRVVPSLRPDGLWLFADFTIPDSGWRRWRALLWVGFLYTSFRWLTGLAVRTLPPSEEILRAAGLRVLASATLQQGLLRVVLYQKPRQT